MYMAIVQVKFGCRDLYSYVDKTTQGRIFICNGEPVFIRGGNWIDADGMLRYILFSRFNNQYQTYLVLVAYDIKRYSFKVTNGNFQNEICMQIIKVLRAHLDS